MNMTQTEKALFAGLLTLLVTSISASSAGLHPFLANGNIDWNGMYIYLMSTGLPTLGAAIITYVKTHPQEVEQAAEDALTQAHIPAPDLNLLHAGLGEIKGLLLAQQNAQPTIPAPAQPPAVQPIDTSVNLLAGTNFAPLLQPTSEVPAVQAPAK